MSLILKEITSPVNLHTEVQDGYLIDYLPEAEVYINGQKETSKPAELTFEWTSDNEKQFTLLLSTSADFEKPQIFETIDTKVTVSNLFLATKYYAKVVSCCEESNVISFVTSERGPRFIDIDGVTNVRDIGGWMTESGKRINQGLLYRGAIPYYRSEGRGITEKGLNTALNELKFKTEIELRDADLTEISFFGESVQFINIPMKEYTPQTAGEKACAFFKVLSDKSIYPAYFHCHSGADRTGFLTFLLLSLLGVGREDWMREYSSTNLSLSEWPRNRSEVTRYEVALADYPGAVLSEKTENYLLSVGVTADEINSIKNIFLA